MDLIEGSNTTILTLQVVYLQYVSNFYKPSISGLECPTMFNNTLTNLIVLDPKEDPLIQIIVPYNNLASYLRIIYYLTSTNFMQNLIPQQEVIVATLAETAFKE